MLWEIKGTGLKPDQSDQITSFITRVVYEGVKVEAEMLASSADEEDEAFWRQFGACVMQRGQPN